MTTPRTINIAYADNQLIQRFLGSRGVQGKIIEFFLSDGAVVRGLTTGMDDDGYQVCEIPSLTATILSTDHVIQMRETEETIDDLPADLIEDAKRFTKIFRRVADKELSRGENS